MFIRFSQGFLMSKIFKGLMSIVGLGGGAPSVSNAANKEVAADQATSKSARASIYATEGGVSGQELDPSQVKKRQTIFGN